MIAGPSSPGVGAPVYQPAGNPLGGTSIVPSAFSPRSISGESTPIAGICRRTGLDFARWAASTGVGAATLGDGMLREGTLGDKTLGPTSVADGPVSAGPEQPAIAKAIAAIRTPRATTRALA